LPSKQDLELKHQYHQKKEEEEGEGGEREETLLKMLK
jgi:hypothetical protein